LEELRKQTPKDAELLLRLATLQNGKLHALFGATIQTVASVARWLSMEPTDIVLISNYTGGGFGSKASGTITSIIPALLSKKANAPVQMRISREDEHYIGGARPAVHGRVKAAFSKEGRSGCRHVRRRRGRSVRG
jgi:CO/xanthine dehydrogenase Mo-binding subunit